MFIKTEKELKSFNWSEDVTVKNINIGNIIAPRNRKLILKGSSILINYNTINVELYDGSYAYLYEDSIAVLFDNAKVVLWDKSKAVCNGNSSAKLFNTSTAELYCNSSAELYDMSYAIGMIDPSKVICQAQSKYNKIEYKVLSMEDLIKWYGISVKNNKIPLYKWTQENYTDHRSGTIDYSQDKVICPDWKEGFDKERGNGFHLAISPEHALWYRPQYNILNGRMLKFMVDINQCYIWTGSNIKYPGAIRAKQLDKAEAELYFNVYTKDWMEYKHD